MACLAIFKLVPLCRCIQIKYPRLVGHDQVEVSNETKHEFDNSLGRPITWLESDVCSDSNHPSFDELGAGSVYSCKPLASFRFYPNVNPMTLYIRYALFQFKQIHVCNWIMGMLLSPLKNKTQVLKVYKFCQFWAPSF